MQRWKMSVVEPSLDDLLGDEIMIPVMRSAGLSAEQLRADLRATAQRLARLKTKSRTESGWCCA
jgi:hypothetical protein